jgi:hypothetical protein
MTAEETERVVRGLYDSFNEKDLDRLDAVADWGALMDFTPFDTRVALRDAWLAWAHAFPDAKVELTRLEVQDDQAEVEFTGQGTHTGALRLPDGVIRPTHRKVTLHFRERYVMNDATGKIAGGTSDFDAASLFEQLGVEAPLHREREPQVVSEYHWGY